MLFGLFFYGRLFGLQGPCPCRFKRLKKTEFWTDYSRIGLRRPKGHAACCLLAKDPLVLEEGLYHASGNQKHSDIDKKECYVVIHALGVSSMDIRASGPCRMP